MVIFSPPPAHLGSGALYDYLYRTAEGLNLLSSSVAEGAAAPAAADEAAIRRLLDEALDVRLTAGQIRSLLEGAAGPLRSRLAAAEARLAAAAEALAALEPAVESLRSSAESLESSAESLEARLTAAEARLDALEGGASS